MTALRIANVVVWAVMLLYMTPGAVASVTKRARYGDPMRLACALTAILFIGFNAFWLWGASDQADLRPAEATTLKFLLVLSAALGCYILSLGRTYGRGSLLKRRDNDA